MPLLRSLAAGLLCIAACAQETGQMPQFKTSVEVVVAPVTVLDEDGNHINGLQPYQFHLFDNEKPQDIKVDVTYQPISLVIAVQASGRVEDVLPQVRNIGSMIQPLVIGEQGEAAVVAFDHRIRVMQDFTNDSDEIAEAVKKITAGSSSSRMIDAVSESVRMLRRRPPDRRRILLLISETRDRASEGRVREALIDAQFANVIVYSVDVSRFMTTLTAKQAPPRPDPMLPAARAGTLPAGVPATPTTVAQTFGQQGGRAEFLPLLLEIYKDVKAIFIDNPLEVFTKGTGGSEYGFMRRKGLEEAITRIGEELHSQYLIAYHPNDMDEGGFHEIQVRVDGHPRAKVRTRPGYWLAAKY